MDQLPQPFNVVGSLIVWIYFCMLMKKVLLTLSGIFFCSVVVVGQQGRREKSEEVATDVVHKELVIPNAFSPNSDGQNDIFKIMNITTEKLVDFKVFNRWGTILFRTNDSRSGWDGNYEGQAQPVGTYGYAIRIGYPDGYIETYKGIVTLIR